MSVSRVLAWILVLLLTARISHAASYPAGVSSQTFDFPDGTVSLSDGSQIGSEVGVGGGSPIAGVFNAALRLSSKNVTNAIGSFKLPDLDPGNVVRSFDLKFTVLMNSLPDGLPGEGWSVNFGRIPADNGTGEGGFAPLPRGLSIAFDTHENGDSPAGILISVGGVVVGTFPRSFNLDAAFRQVTLHWDAAGLDLSFENRVVCTDLATPGFNPGVGDVFAFTSRTTTSGMEVAIDGLRAMTVGLPAIDTGGPIISEFVANNSLFEDEYAGKPGWLELLNGSPDPVDLTGWYLTNSKNTLTKWKIQGLRMNPYNYQVIFASGRNLQLTTSNLVHASFTLDKNTGYLALVRPDGKTVASEYSYGPQDKDVAFGEMGTNRVRGYMMPPSPGSVNTAVPAPGSLSSAVSFSHDGGLMPDPITLKLGAAPLPGLEIHYTLDRTEPGPSSPIYSTPINISSFTTVKARTLAPGQLPGPVSSRTYVLVDSTLKNFAGTGKGFESNLPFLYVDSFGFSVDGSSGGIRPYRPGYLVSVMPDAATGRATLDTVPEYAGPCAVHLHGESSAGFDQHSYALEVQDDLGADRKVGLLGMPADSDWILYGPWSEKTLMRNKLIYDWMRAARGEDGLAVRTRFVELFFNQAKPVAGRVGNASYQGVYLLMEKLKRGKDRVSLQNMNDKTVAPDLITGGYIIRKDKDDALKNNWTTTSFSIPLQSFDPDKLNTPQFNYIKGYVNSFEKALTSTSFRNPRTGYAAYIDPDTFIDAQWMLEISKQVDGYVFSTYFHKDRSGRLGAGPIWDFNISLGNADYATGDTPTGWLYDVPNGVGQLWYPRLHADPDYKLAHWDRYWQLRTSLLSTETVMQTIDQHMATLLDGYPGGVSNRAPNSIQNPVARHFRKWPRLGSRDWPNPPAAITMRTWQDEVGYLKSWLQTRLDWLDDQSLRNGRVVLRPPVLSHRGGVVGGPVQLVMTAFHSGGANSSYPDGVLYYTLDKSDPRLPGGAVSSHALKYARAVTVTEPVTVKARLYYQNQWSPLATATFLYAPVPASPANLIISEILYQPAPVTADESTAGIVDSQNFEFLELHNRSRQTVDLAGVHFGNGLEFDFHYAPPAGRWLRAGESVVVVADVRAFSLRNPRVPGSKIAGAYRGQLSNGGETLALLAADGSVVQEFRYNDKSPWPNAGSGEGFSLILKDPLANPDPADPASWVLSAKVGGTPGVSGRGADRFEGDLSQDTDGDGLTDYFEFATGSDAADPNSANRLQVAMAPVMVNGVEASYLTVAVRRNPTVTGVRLVLESSGNLQTWRGAEADLIRWQTIENPDGTVTEDYRSVLPWTGAVTESWFVRLQVQPQ